MRSHLCPGHMPGFILLFVNCKNTNVFKQDTSNNLGAPLMMQIDNVFIFMGHLIWTIDHNEVRPEQTISIRMK